MRTKTLRQFQVTTIAAAVQGLRIAREKYTASSTDVAGKAMVASHHGCLLLEAPTGAGKTLMAHAE